MACAKLVALSLQEQFASYGRVAKWRTHSHLHYNIQALGAFAWQFLYIFMASKSTKQNTSNVPWNGVEGPKKIWRQSGGGKCLHGHISMWFIISYFMFLWWSRMEYCSPYWRTICYWRESGEVEDTSTTSLQQSGPGCLCSTFLYIMSDISTK